MCELCNGKGWILTMNLNLLQWTIEKCDECNIFPDDESAGDPSKCRTGVAIKRQFMVLRIRS